MTLLPIVGRELRVAARRRGTYWTRTGAALVVIVVGTWLFLFMQHEPTQDVARALFYVLTGGAAVYCLFSGTRTTADCLSEEKREGTLGLLFLTDLRGYDVVLGKLAATSLNALYGVLAVVPMLAVPLLMGGVTLGEFGRMALVALNTLFFSLAIGLCVSAFCRSARAATGVTFILIMTFAGVLPASGAILNELGKISTQTERYFLLPSAGYNFARAFDFFFRGGGQEFWQSLKLIHAMAWIFLGIATLIAPRSWKDKPAGVRKLRWRQRWQQWSYGNLPQRRAFRGRLLDANAFFWLSARGRLKPAMVWAALGLLGCGWLWGWTKFQRDWLNLSLYITTAVLLNGLLKGWFASESGRQIAEDRQQGALELLLVTPLTVRNVLRGQWLALRRQFFGPMLVILFVEFVFLLAAKSSLSYGDPDKAFVTCLWLAGMTMLVADLSALYWLGMWRALSAKNSRTAAGSAVARILVLPWLAFALVSLVVLLIQSRRGNSASGWFFLWLWFGLGLAADIGFGAWARVKLLSEFREVAAQRYERRRGWLRRVLMVGK